MYLLYLDESGGAKEKDQGHYVLGGVSVHERKPYFISEALDELQQRIFPKVTDPIEFHSSVIRNGNGAPWDSMPRKERMEVLSSVYALLAQMTEKIALFAVAFDKAAFMGTDPVQKTCEEIAGHFDAFLTRVEEEETRFGKQRGLMIFDQCNHQATLHALLAQYRSTGASWGKVKHLMLIRLFQQTTIGCD